MRSEVAFTELRIMQFASLKVATHFQIIHVCVWNSPAEIPRVKFVAARTNVWLYLQRKVLFDFIRIYTHQKSEQQSKLCFWVSQKIKINYS